jgi:hypothetical protein
MSQARSLSNAKTQKVSGLVLRTHLSDLFPHGTSAQFGCDFRASCGAAQGQRDGRCFVRRVFVIASWTVLRSKASGQRWGIAASVINILVALITTVLSHRFIQPSLMVVLGIGLVGMFAFTSRMEKPVKMKENLPLPGDWTNPLATNLVPTFPRRSAHNLRLREC